MVKHRFPPTELDDFAPRHVAYEVRMMVEHACQLHAVYPEGLPVAFQNHVEDALLEATLVHLRLLDDFLGLKRKDPRDMLARDWVAKWRPQPGWLTADVRRRINQQLAHLSREREDRFAWDLRAYVHDCCLELERWASQVQAENPDRFRALSGVLESLREGLQGLTPPE